MSAVILGFVTLWAQVAPAGSPATGDTTAADLSLLALRRWCGSLTLSPADADPRIHGLLAWLTGLLLLALAMTALQGPRRAGRQFLDVLGHLRTIGRAVTRLRQAARLITVLLGSTVLVWTAAQLFRYQSVAGFENLALIRKSRSTVELAIDHGFLAAITPFRDVAGLGDNILLVLAATLLVFRRAADRWGVTAPSVPGVAPLISRRMPPWSSVCWASAALYAIYRIAWLIGGYAGLPFGGCVILEAAFIPLLMLIVDGLTLAWVLVELRSISLGSAAPIGVDVAGTVNLLPGAMITCLLLLPARYSTSFVWLLAGHVPELVASSGLGLVTLGSGLVVLQSLALVFFALPGGLAWSRGGAGSAWRGMLRLARSEGGRILALTLLGTAVSGIVSALAYLILLSFPASSWLLLAADSYAHLATLPIALLTLAALVDLGERTLPTATLAEPNSSRAEPSDRESAAIRP